ncbi:MAG: DUF5050 domain-containing protein [Kofleriaceae bacterium]|nr:DUF5050 domain-containing protein [Kofleriaceae bacterium]
MKQLVVCALLLGACSDDDGESRTPELVTETSRLIMSVAVGDAVYLSTSDETIWTVAKEGGTAAMLVANDPGSRLTVAGDHLYWANTLASVNGDRFELSRVPLAGGTPQVLAPEADARSFVVDGDTVYFTSGSTSPDAKVTIYSVPVGGGTPAVVTTGGLIESTGALAVDGTRIYASTNKTLNSRLLSFAKDGSDGIALTDDAAGTGGIAYVTAHGDKLYFIANTGGGAFSHVLKVVAKAGGEPVAYYQNSSVDDTYCTSMIGFAMDDDFIYVACRAHTSSMIRRVSVDGGAFSTLATFPDAANPGGETYSPTIAVMDDTHVYVGLGPRLYRIEK